MKPQNKTRAMMMALVGGYVVYLAYEIMRNGLAGKDSMPMWACILFTILLGGGGIAVIVLAWKIYRTKEKVGEDKTEEPEKTE